MKGRLRGNMNCDDRDQHVYSKITTKFFDQYKYLFLLLIVPLANVFVAGCPAILHTNTMLLLLAVGAALFIWFLVTFTHRPQYDKKKTQALLEKYNKLAPDQIVIPPAKVFLHAQERPTAPAYAVKKSNDSMELTVTTYQAFAQQIKNMAKSLSTLQLKKQTSYQQLGETVSIMARNVPEYVVALHACSACSIVSSGIYFTCAPNQVEYILNHAESKVLFIQQDLLGKLDTIADQLKHLKHIVVIGAKQDALPKFNGIKVYTFEEFITLGSGLDDSIVTRMIDEINADHVSTLIYTSGTTGPPKAAMLSYRNLSACSSRVITSIDHAITAKSILISYLPYAHVAEQVISYLCSCIVGCQVVFCEDARQVLDFLTLTRPHFFFGVPRVWEKVNQCYYLQFRCTLVSLPNCQKVVPRQYCSKQAKQLQ